jgi:hypothetical protein
VIFPFKGKPVGRGGGQRPDGPDAVRLTLDGVRLTLDGVRLTLEVPVTLARARRADRGERPAGATL